MRKLSVFYEHILQACEQSGKTIPEVLAFCREGHFLHDNHIPVAVPDARVLQGAGNFGC